MGIDYSVRVAFGVPITELVGEYCDEKKVTKYNPDTGEPYEVTVYEDYCTMQAGKKNLRFDELWEAIDYIEYEMDFQVCRDDSYGSGEDYEGAIIGEYEELAMSEGIELPREEIINRLDVVYRELTQVGFKIDRHDVKMHIMPQVC